MRFLQQFDKKQNGRFSGIFLRQTASEKQTLWNIKWITEDWNHFLKSLSDFPFRTTILSMLVLGIWPGFWILENWKYFDMLYYLKQKHLMVCFIYIFYSSNSSSFTFWTSQFNYSSICNRSSSWNGISNDQFSQHFVYLKRDTKAAFWNVAYMTSSEGFQTLTQLEPVCCKKQQKKFLTSYWFAE